MEKPDLMLTRARISTGRLKCLVAAISIFALSGCRLTGDNPTSLTLGILGGDDQIAPAGTVFPESLRVIVVDQFGFSTEGVTIAWAITSGGGSLSETSTKSDVDGVSSVTYTAGATAGRATITATVTGLGTVTFGETIT
jgi:hypothetical protein